MRDSLNQQSKGYELKFKIAGDNTVRPDLPEEELRLTYVEQPLKRLAPIDSYASPEILVLGVPFGGPIEGRDEDGEAFYKKTDIWLKPGDQVPVTYYHGFGPDSPEDWQEIPAAIGRAVYDKVDDRGHWFRVRLDEEEPLALRILKALEEGEPEIKASSGAVSHLVRYGKAGLIDVWPVGELALFDINDWRKPANDYATAELAEAKAERQEAAKADQRADSVNVTQLTSKVVTGQTEVNTMSENTEDKTQETKAPVIDYAAIANAVVEGLEPKIADMVQTEIKAIWDQPAGERKAPAVVKSLDGDLDPVEDYLNWVRTGVGRIQEHTVHKTIKLANGMEYKAALQEGTDSEGGYLVPADELGRIIQKRDEMALTAQLPGLVPFTTDRDVFNIPAEGTAMTKFTIVAEEGNITPAENEPTFAQVAVTLYKFMKLVKVSTEIMEDYNTGLSNFLNTRLGAAWGITENYYIQVGTGSSQPQGAFVGGTAGLTLDGTSAIAAAEVPELIGKLKIPYRTGAVAMMNRTTGAYLSGLTGNQFQFRNPPASNITAGGDDMGIGYPVYLTEDAAAIAASAKSMLFGNFGFYGWVRNRSLRVQRLVELYAGTGQIGLLAQFRAGGGVLQAEAFQYASHPSA